MNNTDSEQPKWLREALNDLPKDLTPERDLWPEVAQKLSAQTGARAPWRSTVMAASVLFSVLAGGGSVYLYQQQQVLRNEVASVRLQQLEAPYEYARVSYHQQWQTIKTNYDPQTVALIEKNLATIRDARAELARVLDKNPDDEVVQQLIRQSLAQEIATYEQLQKAKPDFI